MDTGELRKRILRALDDARMDASKRRLEVDEAARAYDTFLTTIAVPLVRQAAMVLKAEGQPFVANTPADSVRLSSEASPQTFLEIVLDRTSAPRVLGRVSLTRGRQGMIVEERPIVEDKAIAEITEDDVTRFLVAEVVKLVMRP